VKSILAIRLLSLLIAISLAAGGLASLDRPVRAAAADDLGLPFVGVFMHNHDAPATARAAAAGAAMATVEVHWADLEPVHRSDGSWDAAATANLDIRFTNVSRNRLVPVAVVGWAPWWAATSTRGPLNAGQEGNYLAFVRALVQRYSQSPYGVHHWMLWPEPDAERSPTRSTERASWGDDGAAFAALLRQTYPAIKQADPTARVILGPLAHDWFDDPDGRTPGFNSGGIFRYRFLDDVLSNGAAGSFDALGLNAYLAFASGWETHGGGVDVAAKIDHVRKRLQGRGVDVPIVVGESGFWSAGDEIPATDGSGRVVGSLQPSEEVQAAYVAKLYARARDAGAAATIWFTLDDYESLPTKYGIYASSGASKLAQPAYKWAAAALGDSRRRVPASWVRALDGQVESYGSVGLGRWTAVAWATGSLSPRARVSVLPGARAYDRAGKELASVGIGSDGAQLYDLGDSPVYFERTAYVAVVPLVLRSVAAR
jgi:hypothetical protein